MSPSCPSAILFLPSFRGQTHQNSVAISERYLHSTQRYSSTLSWGFPAQQPRASAGFSSWLPCSDLVRSKDSSLLFKDDFKFEVLLRYVFDDIDLSSMAHGDRT